MINSANYLYYNICYVNLLFCCVIFQPFLSAHVRQMFHSEVLKFGFKSVSIRRCCHDTDLHRNIVLHPRITHHCVFFIIERIEHLYSIKSSYSLNPDIRNRLVKSNDTPVGCLMSNHCTKIVLAIDKFNSCLDISILPTPLLLLQTHRRT